MNHLSQLELLWSYYLTKIELFEDFHFSCLLEFIYKIDWMQSMSRSMFSSAHARARAQKILSAHARAQIFSESSAQIGARM